MKRKFTILFMAFFVASAFGQNYLVTRTTFSSRLTDEFSPFFYRDGLVFCSNIRDNSPVAYSGDEGRLFKIFFVEGSDSMGWRKPGLFSEDLVSGLNDGPATFTPDGRTIYFSRNNKPVRKFRDTDDRSNRLGIWYATLSGNRWTAPFPFIHNDTLHSFCTPCISPDGKKLYFASDKPGGYGEMDLYMCDRNDEGWSNPVNLGPEVNTMANEAFPFETENGILWFASDGHGGLGRKDLFYTSEIDGKWKAPVNPGAPLNSSSDDFGLIAAPFSSSGFFSSDRSGTDDILSYMIAPPQFDNCLAVRENTYCFTLYDEKHKDIDTLQAKYYWDFGGGDIREGVEAWYCFPGPGSYAVFLTITDELTGDTITRQSRYDVELMEIEQGYISCPDQAERGAAVVFNGTKVNLMNFNVTGYWWDIGEGFFPGGPVISTTFKKAGEYEVKMGLSGKSTEDGTVQVQCYSRKITVN